MLMQDIHQEIQEAVNYFVDGIRKSGNFSACYLTGSYAERYAVTKVSDIDITVVSESPLDEIQRQNLESLIQNVDHTHGVNLDVSPVVVAGELYQGQSTFLGIAFREAVISAKLAGHLIWGRDVFARIPMPSKDEYVDATRKIPFEFPNRIRGYSNSPFPLGFPNEHDQYFGYLGKHVDGNASTKPLISLMTWIGTGTVALISGTPVGNKKQCVDALKEIDLGKGVELARLFDLCRREWKYRLPASPNDQQDLRDICARALVWENEYHDKFFPDMQRLGT